MAQLSSSIPPGPLQSILNFRDVAQTINNLPLRPKPKPRLKPHLFYRSARPDGASPEDRQALAQKYHIKTILDLRSKTEHLEAAEKFDKQQQEHLKIPQTVNAIESELDAIDDSISPSQPTTKTLKIPTINYEAVDLNGSAFMRAMFWKLSWFSMSRLLYLMTFGYRAEAIQIWTREIMAPRGLTGLFKDCLDLSQVEVLACFKVLAEAENYPILVHCTQGKDRTGLIVLMVLFLLEVPVEAIEADYFVSERELLAEKEHRMEEFRRMGLGEEFAECPAGFVRAMKDHLDGEWGGVEGYLEKCGVNSKMREQIRWKLLREDAQ